MADIIPPPLREELKIAKLVQMGELSYVIKEPDKQSFYHFEPAQYELMSLFNGSRTLIQIIELFNLRSSEYEYDLEDAEELYDSCREFQLLTRTRAEQNTALLEKISEERKKKLLQSQGSALFLRFQLVDPNNFFNKIIPKLRFIWDPRVIKLQIAFVFCAFLAVLFQGERFFDDFNRVYLQAHQHDFGLLSIWLIALFAIAIHECGHGLTCKYFGGDVHEMGFLLLAFQPCLYCNVNDAWLFEEKRHKIYVAIAGVWVEILLAAISGFVWLIVDVANPIGYVAFVLLTIGTATSILVNLNPLLKFDGYYILTDLLEIRNLRQNSIAWFSYKLKTRLFRMDEEAPLTPTTRERRVYMIYGCSVVVYMFFMLSFIAILGYNLVSAQFGFIANLAFIWLVFLLVKKLTGDWGKTLKNWSREVFWGSTLRRKLSLVAVVLTVILIIFWQPRIRVHSTGAVDAPTHIVYAPESGFISQLAFDNQRELTGQKNQPLLTLNSYELELAGIELRSAENMLIMQQQESLSADDAIESQRLRIEQSLLNEKLLSLNKQYTSLEIQKPEGDWLVDSMPKQSLLGRYFGSGQPILTLVAKKKRFIDVVVDQRDVYLITQGDRGLIRFSGVGPAIYDAHLESISPVAKLDGIEQSLIVRMSIMTDNNLQTPPLGLSGDVMILGQPTPLFMHFVHTIRKILRADLWL